MSHERTLYSAALRATKNHHDAEDLLQEVFLKAFRNEEQYQAGTNLRAWLHRILKTIYIDSYRKKARRLDEVEFGELQEAYTPAKNTSPHPEELKVEGIVLLALHALPDPLRVVVMLADISSCSYYEISELLSVPIGTVMSRLHRGRKALQKEMWHFYHQEAM